MVVIVSRFTYIYLRQIHPNFVRKGCIKAFSSHRNFSINFTNQATYLYFCFSGYFVSFLLSAIVQFSPVGALFFVFQVFNIYLFSLLGMILVVGVCFIFESSQIFSMIFCRRVPVPYTKQLYVFHIFRGKNQTKSFSFPRVLKYGTGCFDIFRFVCCFLILKSGNIRSRLIKYAF